MGKGLMRKMEKVYEICGRCGDSYCCRGICKEMNDYLVKQKNRQEKRKCGMQKSTSKV